MQQGLPSRAIGPGLTAKPAALFPRLDAVAMAVLLALLLLGGSSNRASLSFLLLSTMCLLLLAASLLRPQRSMIALDPFLPFWALGGATLILLHLVPLPPWLWSGLPGREMLLTGFKLSGVAPGWRPLSLDPAGTLSSLMWLLTPATAVALALRGRDIPRLEIALTVVAFSAASLLAGLLQVSGPPDSALYFHQVTNWGLAVGFFANANHLGTLLLIAQPLLAATTIAIRSAPEQRTMRLLVVAGFAVPCLAGIVLTRSIACLILFPVALGISLAIAAVLGSRSGRWIALAFPAAAAVALIAGAYVFPRTALVRGAVDEAAERAELAENTTRAIGAYWPVGSGLGSFVPVYPPFQDAARLSDRYANHAHNDYLELTLEAGLPGLLLIVSLVGWWGLSAWRAWDRRESGGWRRAAAGVLALVLCHSIVDYPLRTPAIAAIVALQLVILAQRTVIAKIRPSVEIRPARHLTLESDQLRFP